MSSNRFAAALSSSFVLSVLLAACGPDTPTSPRTPPPPPPPQGTPVTVTRVVLDGPTTVNPGPPVQYTATAQQSDGTTRDVTAEAAWRVFNPSVLSMTAPGLFTGVEKGETGLSVLFAGRSAVIGNVIVVPAGTYKLSGTIVDEGQPVPDAVVEIQDEAIGISRIPAPGGPYRIFGVAGDTKITVFRSGYEPATKRQTITGHTVVDVALKLSKPREDLSGRYALAITASPDCSARLPEGLRERNYTAVITQAGPNLTVTLEGAQFFNADGRTLNRFTGVLQPGVARFTLTSTGFDYYSYFYAYPDVFEMVPGSQLLSFEGTASLTPAGSVLDGTLNGSIGVFTGPPFRSQGRCKSPRHRMVFSK